MEYLLLVLLKIQNYLFNASALLITYSTVNGANGLSHFGKDKKVHRLYSKLCFNKYGPSIEMQGSRKYDICISNVVSSKSHKFQEIYMKVQILEKCTYVQYSSKCTCTQHRGTGKQLWCHALFFDNHTATQISESKYKVQRLFIHHSTTQSCSTKCTLQSLYATYKTKTHKTPSVISPHGQIILKYSQLRISAFLSFLFYEVANCIYLLSRSNQSLIRQPTLKQLSNVTSRT